MAGRTTKDAWFRRHSLSVVAIAFLMIWIIGYRLLDPKTHLGSFFGNAIVDWSGSLVIILGTKFFYEVGSAESRPVRGHKENRWLDLLHRHSLLVVIAITGLGWLLLSAYESTGQMGTGRKQYRFRMGSDGRACLPYQTPGGTWLERKPLRLTWDANRSRINALSTVEFSLPRLSVSLTT